MSDPCRLPQTERLHQVIAALRTEGSGCPWDLQQTETSMAPHLLEEAHEAVAAIESGDAAAVREELGDVLMNVLLIARIAEQAGRFTGLEDVARTVADKLVRRHPHVFGDVEERDADRVLANWEAIKRSEGGGAPRSVVAGVPDALPALLKALRVGEKVARTGFDWPDARGPRAKLDEELAELDDAIAGGDADAIAGELGDVLFSVCNVARHHRVNPEMALRATIDRFLARFRHVEGQLGNRLGSAGLDEMERLWQQAKRAET